MTTDEDPLFELDGHLADAHASSTAAAWRTYNLWMAAFAVTFLAGIGLTCLGPWLDSAVGGWVFLAGVAALVLSVGPWFKANSARATWATLFDWTGDGDE